MHIRRNSWLVLVGFAVLTAGAETASGAAFDFSSIIRLGSNASSTYEVALGNNASPTAIQLTMTPWWTSGESRQFQFIYTAPTNTMEVRVYNNNSGAYGFYAYNPAGGPPTANSTWVLPASSFFVTADPGSGTNSISITGLSLSSPTGGAINVLSPFSTTSIAASSGGALPAQTVNQGSDIVFQGDANGSWRLSGFVTMTFSGLPGGNGNVDRLQFGIGATADTPEASTWALMAIGLIGLGAARRRQSRA